MLTTMAGRKNPIERRLGELSAQWIDFADLPDARLLCWTVTPDEERMVEAFVAVESDDDAGALPDLFVPLSVPFDPAQAYGFALCGEFKSVADALHAGLDSPETAVWVPPPWQRGESDVSLFARTCTSFIQHFALPRHLALWLTPKEIGDAMAFQVWLQRLLSESPPTLRLIVLDAANATQYEPLCRAEPVRVVRRAADLDMPGARLEISRAAGALDTPGGKYRHHFVQMTNALGEQDLAKAQTHAATALAISAEQRWFVLAVPVHLALGATLSGENRVQEANECYLAAEIAATDGERAGDATCSKLKVQARMIRGGLLISARAYRLAATLFTETIPLAQSTGDARMTLDCYRLACFCHEQDGQYDKAWQFGTEGVAFAQQLEKADISTSTLPYLGENLMRLCERSEFSGMQFRIERELVRLLGRVDWRPTTHVTGSANPAAASAPSPGAGE